MRTYSLQTHLHQSLSVESQRTPTGGPRRHLPRRGKYLYFTSMYIYVFDCLCFVDPTPCCRTLAGCLQAWAWLPAFIKGNRSNPPMKRYVYLNGLLRCRPGAEPWPAPGPPRFGSRACGGPPKAPSFFPYPHPSILHHHHHYRPPPTSPHTHRWWRPSRRRRRSSRSSTASSPRTRRAPTTRRSVVGVVVVFCRYTLVWVVVFRCASSHFVSHCVMYIHTHTTGARGQRRRVVRRGGGGLSGGALWGHA